MRYSKQEDNQPPSHIYQEGYPGNCYQCSYHPHQARYCISYQLANPALLRLRHTDLLGYVTDTRTVSLPFLGPAQETTSQGPLPSACVTAP